MSVSFLRHNGFFGPENAQQLNIIGVGATGSWIGLLAAKMGFHDFQIWDADIVETHNLPNQIYDDNHTGKKKVDAFEEVLTRFNPAVKVKKHDYFFETEKHKDMLEGPLVLTVDTMFARADIYDSFKLNWKVNKVYETRLGFDVAEINVIDNMNLKELQNWKNSLVKDEDVPEGPCNLRTCTTLVNMVASYTVHRLCSALADKEVADASETKKHLFNLNPVLSTHNI